MSTGERIAVGIAVFGALQLMAVLLMSRVFSRMGDARWQDLPIERCPDYPPPEDL